MENKINSQKGILIKKIESVQFIDDENGWGLRYHLECLCCKKIKYVDILDSKKVEEFSAALEAGNIPFQAQCVCWLEYN